MTDYDFILEDGNRSCKELMKMGAEFVRCQNITKDMIEFSKTLNYYGKITKVEMPDESLIYQCKFTKSYWRYVTGYY